MLKNKVNYKLVNFTLIALIVFLIYKTGNLWIGIISKVGSITYPFLIAFALAYAVYPFLNWMVNKKVPKGLGVGIIVFIILLILGIVVYLVTTVMITQVSGLFNSIISFLNSLSKTNFDFNFVGLESSLSTTFKNIMSSIGTYVSNGAINLVNTSIGFLSKAFIIFASFIYFLIDMDKIRKEIKKYLLKKKKKIYNYVYTLDLQMKNYLSGLVQVMIISFVEYTLVYTLIGHPQAILLGFLASIANLIPYFGGIGVNVIAAITAFAISPALLIRTIISFVILSAVDSYVINPTVYGKTNSIHPLVTIISLFAFGVIFGITGVFISFPLAIICVTTYKYFKEDINKNIGKVKDNFD